jgi:ribosomal protein S18 acetylase RimI-like enzyme
MPIRVATDADVPELATINHEVQALHRRAQPEKYRDATVLEIAARFRELLADPDIVILVSATTRVAGYAVVKRVDSPGHVFALPRVTAVVDQLGVLASARRGGHGRALMAAAEAQARTWQAAALTLDVQAFNADAIAFYQALGYAILTYRLTKSP